MSDFFKYYTKYGVEYIRLPLMSVVQKGESFFVSKIPAAFLVETFVVHPTEYDITQERQAISAFPDEEDIFKERINSKLKLIDDLKSKGYQREVDPVRVKAIASFLESEDVAFFPNTIILTCELINDYIDVDQWEDIAEDDIKKYAGFVFVDKKLEYIYVPKLKNTLLVVDGQHRLEGIKSAVKIMDDYEVLVSFIIGYERSVIASLFYTINHEQKNVNKSVLYHLKAEFSHEIDELTFLHELLRVLNASITSPFSGRIKMLGRTPKGLNVSQRKMMTLSQAFLIDSLWYTLKETVSNSKMLPIFRYYFDRNEGVLIAKYIANYFKAVRKLRPDWDKPEASQISKTLGVGALIKVMNDIFAIQFVEENIGSRPKIIGEFTPELFIKYLDGLNLLDISEYAKSSSAGGVGKLSMNILSSLNIFQSENHDFENRRVTAAARLRDWLNASL